MKTKYLFIMLIFLAACSGREKLSDAYGNFEAVEKLVASQANGQILWLKIEEGNRLDSGAVVGLIDTTDLYLKKQQLLSRKNAVAAGIESVRAQMDVQKQQKENLLVDRNRLEKLFEEGAATQKQMDDVKGAVELAEKQIDATRSNLNAIYDEVAAIESQIKQVKENIRKCYIRNTTDGTVLTKISESGEVTAFGRPLYRIAGLDPLILKAYVSGEQLPDVKLGQKVEVQVDKNAEENQSFEGTISWISDQAEFTPKIIQTKEDRINLVYAVKVLVPNDGTLKIGMPGEVNFKDGNEK
ncbi:MAG: efflux RND transporter periplasmic adaptor subunit [Bacteroidales bacterium]|nr:efflux RND transporter periplasmic adaptor subunit [Bacteroidales bacterium]MCF8345115.1 efflux RND transporter periplasmic adaptor subunit [Bacteroidales bacterium]MCF8351977.1 efflux RND transporter periplasmic adaptor subunit [Bacteroidales bacterium]MCF8377471.1 efflux RND transporter periplasmic adaptor subunit [Bacteroidales bacterium]MCF8401594.1 efflux RND transporter periplasmic adaptor subunit [Bacteroidales bacterium]